MDSPQYFGVFWCYFLTQSGGFKPYYKWIVLNTASKVSLNSKPNFCFKPYYKWIVLNTKNYVPEEKTVD